jgi:hypothetical protein
MIVSRSYAISTVWVHQTLTVPDSAPIFLKICNDSSLTALANLTEITPDWFSPSMIYGDYGYRTVYGVLTTNKTQNVTLNIYTENWINATSCSSDPPYPPDLDSCVLLFSYRNISSIDVVDFNGTMIQAPSIMEIDLTLYIPTGAPTLAFSFDIVFNTAYTGEP